MYRIVRKEALRPTVTLYEIQAPLIAKKGQRGEFIILRVDAKGERIDYIHKLDIVAEEPYPQECPPNYKAERVATLDIPECASARVLIYLIPFQLPTVEEVAAVAPLDLKLKIVEDGKVVISRKIGSNAWSGSRFDLRLPFEGLQSLRQASVDCPPV